MRGISKKYLIFGVLLIISVSLGCVSTSSPKIVPAQTQSPASADVGVQESAPTTTTPPTTTAPPTTTPAPTTTAPPTTTPAPTPIWYEGLTANQIKGKTQRITYDTLVRKNEDYLDSIVTFRGEVSRIVGNYDGPYDVLIQTKMNDYGTYNADTIYLSNYDLDFRVIEGDIAHFYGVPDGFKTYEIRGSSKTVPKLIPLLTVLSS
jgi:hypothetical protein